MPAPGTGGRLRCVGIRELRQLASVRSVEGAPRMAVDRSVRSPEAAQRISGEVHIHPRECSHIAGTGHACAPNGCQGCAPRAIHMPYRLRLVHAATGTLSPAFNQPPRAPAHPHRRTLRALRRHSASCRSVRVTTRRRPARETWCRVRPHSAAGRSYRAHVAQIIHAWCRWRR